MASLIVDAKCPKHGIERFSLKIVKQPNVNKEHMELIKKKKPTHYVSGVIIGNGVSYEEARKYLMDEYVTKLSAAGYKILNTRLQL